MPHHLLWFLLATVVALVTWLIPKRGVEPHEARSLDAHEQLILRQRSVRATVFTGNWRDTLVLFVDYYCPYSRDAYLAVADPSAPYALDIRYALLSRRSPSAMAARAAECARERGKLHDFSLAAWQLGEALGRASWKQVAATAAIPLQEIFDECVARPGGLAILAEDSALTAALELVGSPAAIYRGQLHVGIAQVSALVHFLNEAPTAQRPRP